MTRLSEKMKSPNFFIWAAMALFAVFAWTQVAHSQEPGEEAAATVTDESSHSDSHPEAAPHPDEATGEADHGHEAGKHHVPEGYELPRWWAVIPFVVLLLCIAILPLMEKTEHWWEDNKNRLFVSLVLSVIVLFYYWLILHRAGPRL